ncbi:MAG: CdaR family transcriptional regulator [Lachnospirales bacterium]
MEINPSVAQEIIEKLKSIVKQDLNFMNKNAVIIASTDPKRIGSYHQGAELTIASNKNVTIDYDGEYEGSKQGINLPLFFEGNVVGVIGITGAKSEVLVYGEIIKEFTEILLYQNYIEKQNSFYLETKRHFAHEILFSPSINFSDIDVWAGMLKVDYKKFDTVGVLKINIFDLDLDEETRQKIYDKIRASVAHSITIYDSTFSFLLNGEIICFFGHKDRDGVIHGIKKNISSNYANNTNIRLFFTVGSKKSNIGLLKKSYKEAKTLQSLIDASDEDIDFLEYDIKSPSVLLNEIPVEKSLSFIDIILGNIPEKKRQDYINCLRAYYKNNNSIKKTAEELFLHENTVQYKINKIGEYTGLNPKNSKDDFTLKLALRLKNIVDAKK